MIGERTVEGWEVRLRPRGLERYFGGAFLSLWLCGWAVGEAFALWFLIKGALALATGTPPGPGREPLSLGPAVMMGAFLLVWLALWTVGGLAAIHELLRLLWGEDRLLVASGRLTAIWSRGPFRTTRVFERDSIHRISLATRRSHLTIVAGRQRVELSSLGTPAEREQVAAALRTELALPETAGARPALPGKWEEIVTPEGDRALVPNLAVRRRQAQVASGMAMAAAAVTFLLARAAARDLHLLVPAAFALAVTIALAAGAVWLARGRTEWRIGSGRLTFRKRFGAGVGDTFEARRLVLETSSDSDGDDWFELVAVGEGHDPAPAAPAGPSWRPAGGKNRRTVARVMNDGSEVRDLGTWLAGQTGLVLEDRTTSEARAAELGRLLEGLENSGQLGRWASRLVNRLSKPRNSG